jgi:hypothetical protein
MNVNIVVQKPIIVCVLFAKKSGSYAVLSLKCWTGRRRGVGTMTDKEIIKAVECCGRESCCGCPYRGNCHQGNPMIRDALALINRQQAEIERLNNNISAMAITMRTSAKATQAEAVKEFAERLKEHYNEYDDYDDIYVHHIRDDIDFTLEDMVG